MINPTLRTSDLLVPGGSDARTILGKAENAMLRLWREKRGEIEPEDLSGNLLVQFVGATGELNRRWFERETGHSIGAVQRFATQYRVGATLDGIVPDDGAVFEAKFMLSWNFAEDVAADKHMAKLNTTCWWRERAGPISRSCPATAALPSVALQDLRHFRG